MKRPAVFFDRDNTLIVGNEYLGDPEKVSLMPGAADAVSRARALGYATVVFSNQSGVARGMFDEPAVRVVNRRVEERLLEANPNAVIDRQEFCPYHPDAVVERYRKDSDLRKPKPGMILRAAETMALDLPRSWVIGDAPRDIEAGHAAGCRTILFEPPDIERSPAAMEQQKIKPDFTCASLHEAMDFIARQETDEPSANQLQSPPLAAPAVKVEEKPAPKDTISTARLERLCEQILVELRSQREEPANEFSMTKLFAGITQILAIALLFIAYLERNNDTFFGLIFCAQFVQMLTVALAVMGRQR
jgi:D-glycero-D-manno-heptose 1,7-bisphosphate phosphatase